ncbi:MAG: D-glucuronyl C5-epimerase family protein, partial [Actinomycetota bacterium]|nr:D-glucuronyl C5-epimerase family protein [Actinomycetota bacterium]
DEGAIDPATHDDHRATYDRALALERKLTGARLVQLAAVRRTIDAIAGRGQFTVSRVPSLFLTLERNIRWWTTGPLLAPGRRVSFEGSEIVWQYYPGQGLQIQVLGTFGKLNALWRAKRDGAMERLLDEMLALPAERAGGLAWEYLFTFNGGAPPWVSGLAQGTGVQAISRAATRLDRQAEVFPIAQRALAIFEAPPPAGVRVPDGDGAHYLIYSFAPAFRVLNGFAQAVIGLHDFAKLSADPRAQALYEAGERVARRETPAFDTGAWSLYSRGSLTRESDLNYHRLVTDFLSGLCDRTGADAYCGTAERFTDYLTEKPALRVTTRKLRGGTIGKLRFRLSKISRVGVEVRRGGRLVLSRPAFVGSRGERFVGWAVPRAPGAYEVQMTAVDLAGNVGNTAAVVEVLKPKRKRKRP